MKDFNQMQSEAAVWGITLRERFQLEGHVRESLKRLEDFTDHDRQEEEFRGKVGDVLIENRLFSKAARYMECSRFGYRLECEGAARHKFFSPLYCDLRFCPRCGPRQYVRLYQKYVNPIRRTCRHVPGNYRLREITLTSENTGSLTSGQIRKFNEDVKKTLKLLMEGVTGWGALWCDEVGFNNMNLHAHILFYGPFIEQKRLAEVWNQVSGHLVVYITKAHATGARALQHMLKYVSKPPANKPEIVGQLEVAFHGRRRVHAVGVFYNAAGSDPDNLKSHWNECPECGAALRRLPGTSRIENLALEGLEFIGVFRPCRSKTQCGN